MNIQRVNKEGGEKGENEKNKSDKMLTIEELGWKVYKSSLYYFCNIF